MKASDIISAAIANTQQQLAEIPATFGGLNPLDQTTIRMQLELAYLRGFNRATAVYLKTDALDAQRSRSIPPGPWNTYKEGA